MPLRGGISKGLKEDFFAYLAHVLKGGMSFVEALEGFKTVSPEAEELCLRIMRYIGREKSLTQAITRAMEGKLSPFEEAVLAAGERSGKLEVAMERLVEMKQKEREEKKKLIASLIQPILAVVLLVGLVILTLFVTLPRMKTMLEAVPTENIPTFTLTVFAVADYLRTHIWYLLFGLAVPGILFLQGMEVWLELPIFRDLYRSRIQYLFFETLRIYLSSGFTMTQALEQMAFSGARQGKVSTLSQLARRIRTRIMGRSDLVEVLKREPFFDREALALMASFTRSGMSDSVLRMAAEVSKSKFYASVERTKQLISPVIILTVAAIMLVVMLAVWLPLFQIVGAVNA